jgi:hypothetical protein
MWASNSSSSAGHATEVKRLSHTSAESAYDPSTTRSHARDDRRVRLNLDTVLIVAQQMPTAQHVLKEPEENLDWPAFLAN